MSVAEILRDEDAIWAWVMFIEGCPVAFSSRPELVGSGEGSWIGTDHGAREVVLGLIVPPELPTGRSEPFEGEILEAAVTAKLLDFDGRVVELFRDEDQDEFTDTLGASLRPSDDPAPETTVGPLGTSIDLWGRNVGIEAIGPAGERMHFWIWPSSSPPGYDHPVSDLLTAKFPTLYVTDRPTIWAGRKVAIYSIVYDKDTGTWPGWEEQHEGGAMRWIGTLRDHGVWVPITHEGARTRALDLYLASARSWLGRSLNALRPPDWKLVEQGVEFTEANGRVAVWITGEAEWSENEGINYNNYTAQSIISGNTLAGLDTVDAVVNRINNIIQCALQDEDQGMGTVLASSNVAKGGGGPWRPDVDFAYRNFELTSGGKLLRIKMKVQDETAAKFVGNLVLHRDAWALLGFDVHAQSQFLSLDDLGGEVPIGGPGWGSEVAGDNLVPIPGYYWFRASTMSEDGEFDDNNGQWRNYPAPWEGGTVRFHELGGDLVRLAVGEFPCEDQLAAPYKIGDTISGQQVNAAGWWLFRGVRYTENDWAAGDDPVDLIQVALCEWVLTADGLGVAEDEAGSATMRIVRWEDPRRFHLPYKRFKGDWVCAVGSLECTPVAVIGGTLKHLPDKAHWLPVRLLLSSGTAVRSEAGQWVGTTGGDSHVIDQPFEDTYASDMEVRDLGIGLPRAAVDHHSFRRCASKLPGGVNSRLNRSMHVLHGPAQSELILKSIMQARMWAWTLKRQPGAAVPSFGAHDAIATLSVSDVEVVLTDDDKASPLKAMDWEPKVPLRDGGPYDAFHVDAGWDVIEGDFGFHLELLSDDHGRRFRRGQIVWAMEDRGLANPELYSGQQPPDHVKWVDDARSRFASQAGKFWSKRVFLYETIVNPRVAMELGLGTIVRVQDPRAESPQGTRGLDHLGWVVDFSLLTAKPFGGCARVVVLLQPWRVGTRGVWGPIAQALWFDTGTSKLHCSEDYFGVHKLKPTHRDVDGFTEPPYSSIGGDPARVVIRQSEDCVRYPEGFEVRADVIAVDRENNTLTLDNVTGKIYRDMFKWITLDAHSNQTSDWVLALYVPQSDLEGIHAPGQKAKKL